MCFVTIVCSSTCAYKRAGLTWSLDAAIQLNKPDQQRVALCPTILLVIPTFDGNCLL